MTSGVADVLGRVSALIGPLFDEGGEGGDFELIDVAYLSEAGTMVLRVLVDKAPGGSDSKGRGEGIRVEELGRLSKRIGALLEEEGTVGGAYSLEVSSPGLDRPLKKERDYERAVGRKALIKTKEPVDGRKNFKATIDGVSDGVVTVTDSEGRAWALPISNIDKARREIEI